MKQHENMKEISAGFHPVTNSPDLLARFLVRNYPITPVTSCTDQALSAQDIAQCARIRAVGIGILGAEMVQILSRYLFEDISCHEVIYCPERTGTEEMAALISLVKESDLVFILTGFDDECCGVAARTIGHSAREAGILTLAIIPDNENISQQNIAGLTEEDVPVFSVSELSLSEKQNLTQAEKYALTGYSMRHIVTAITNLICYRSLISIDFVDIDMTLRKGLIGRLGVGAASGQEKACKAAKLALERLKSQGMSIFDFEDVLVIVQSSEQSDMDDWADVCKVIHESVVEGTSILIGHVINELLGFADEIKVSVMAVR